MKNIVENNKLIAEFMGVFDKILSTGNIHSWSDAPFYYTTEDTKEKVIKNICKYSKYDSDWNWLMKVVEKINTIDEDRFTVQIFSMDTYIYDSKDRNFIIKTELTYNPDELIKSVYNTCVKFIKWYNSHLCANCGRFDDVVGTHSITICEECALNNTVL